MWLRSKNYISALGVALIITSLDAGAQLAPKMYRIGWLGSAPAVAGENRAAGEFQQGLRDLKYVDGQNIVLEYRHASGNTERLSDFAAELVRSRVDVIVTAGEQAALGGKGCDERNSNCCDGIFARSNQGRSRCESGSSRRQCDGVGHAK